MANNFYSVAARTFSLPDHENHTETLSDIQELFQKTKASPFGASIRVVSDSLRQALPPTLSNGNIATIIKTFAIYTAAAVLLYIGALIIYRLYFSPISHFPGPFLAKVTHYYEFYYNVIQNGTYWLKIEEIHKQYGPIVRVSPTELHVRDANLYNELYVTHAVRPTDADPRFGQGTGFEHFINIQVPHAKHRTLRQPLDKFFSRAGLQPVEERVVAKVQKLSARLEAEKGSGRILNMSNAFSSLAVDAISASIYDDASDYLADSDFNKNWWDNLIHGTMSVFLFKHFPVIMWIMAASTMRLYAERATNWRIWDDKLRRDDLLTKSKPGDDACPRSSMTIFDHLVNHDITEKEFGGAGSFARLGRLFSQAGAHRIHLTLTNIVTYVLLDAEKEMKLRAEVAPFFKDGHLPLWKDLEKAPYLSACVKEGLRLATGVLNRSPRVSPDVDLQFQDWIIPKGTSVSMSSYHMHRDPDVFRNPDDFVPERWIKQDMKDAKLMYKLYVPFARGSRACLGMNLAPMIVYLTAAHLFRPDAGRMELYETDKSDVEPVHGYLFSLPKLESKGVRARIV